MNIMNYILTVLIISMSVFVRSRPLNQDDITVSENDVEAHSILPEILSGVPEPEYLTNPEEPQYNTVYDTSIYNSIDTGVRKKYTHYQPAMSVHQPWSNRARSGHGYHYQPRPAPPHSLYPQQLPVPGHGGYPQPLPAVVRGQRHRQVHQGHGGYDVSHQNQHFQDFKIKKNVNSTDKLDKESVPSVNTDLVKYDYSAPYEHNNYHHKLDYDHSHYDHHMQDVYGKNYDHGHYDHHRQDVNGKNNDHGHYDHHIQDVYGKNYDHGHYDHHIQDVYERDYDHGHHDHHLQDMYGKTNNTEPIESQNWSFGSFLSSVWPFNYHGHGHGQNHRGLGGPGALPEIGLDAVQEVSKDHLLFTP